MSDLNSMFNSDSFSDKVDLFGGMFSDAAFVDKVLKIAEGYEWAMVRDKSGSMHMGGSNDTPIVRKVQKNGFFGGSRNEYMYRDEAVSYLVGSIVDIFLKNDPAPDLGWFDHQHEYFTDCDPESRAYSKFMDIQAGGGTSIRGVVRAAYNAHQQRKRSGEYEKSGKKGMFLLVFLDGDADDREAFKNDVREYSRGIQNPTEFHILFVKVGRESLEAYFQELDELSGTMHDIISYTNLDNLVRLPGGLGQILIDLVLKLNKG